MPCAYELWNLARNGLKRKKRMKLIKGWLIGAVFVVGQLPGIASPQTLAPRMPYQEYAERIKSAGLTAPLTSDLFGDSVSLYNGATQFSATDINVPGNNTLPVQLGRRLKIESRPEDSQILGGFGGWDINVPYISGTFLDNWMGVSDGGGRCSGFTMPSPQASFEAKDYYAGVQVNLPGKGEQEVMRTGNIPRLPMPGDGFAYPLGTRMFDRIRCKENTLNGFPGEGFILRDASGVTYTFDVGFTRNAGVIEKPIYTAEDIPPQTMKANRTKVYLAVSRIEDRFGNWVNYRWSGDKLMEITSNDGRSISIVWNGPNVVSATANNRTWTYTYTPVGMRVTLPDSSFWIIEGSGSLTPRYPWPDLETNGPSCGEQDVALGAQYNPPPQVTITHPSGAIGKFDFSLMRHRRAGIPASACTPVWSWQGHTVYEMAISNYFDVFSLTTKTISGLGMEAQRWTYEYEIIDYYLNQYTNTPCQQCQDAKSVWVREPGGVVKEHRFGVL